MIEEILKKDLRKISEEEFSKVFDWLKNETENFRSIKPEIFINHPQLLLVLRCGLGVTQRELAKLLGFKSRSTLNQLERGSL
jgi:hypothetical protein